MMESLFFFLSFALCGEWVACVVSVCPQELIKIRINVQYSDAVHQAHTHTFRQRFKTNSFASFRSNLAAHSMCTQNCLSNIWCAVSCEYSQCRAHDDDDVMRVCNLIYDFSLNNKLYYPMFFNFVVVVPNCALHISYSTIESSCQLAAGPMGNIECIRLHQRQQSANNCSLLLRTQQCGCVRRTLSHCMPLEQSFKISASNAVFLLFYLFHTSFD